MQRIATSAENLAREKEALALKEEMNRVALRDSAVWLLLSVGFCLVAFPGYLSLAFLSDPRGWSPDALREVAQSLRSVGFLLFSFGLVERTLIRLSK